MASDEVRNRAGQAERRAFEMELNYGCCPQCVLTAVREVVDCGITDETIKASHGLSGGGALMGAGACGALTGGLMALGARKGRDADKMDKGRGMANFNAGKALVERFQAEFGGVTCQDLQKEFTGQTWDLWNAGDYRAFSQARGEQCARASALVARWVVEMLD